LLDCWEAVPPFRNSQMISQSTGPSRQPRRALCMWLLGVG